MSLAFVAKNATLVVMEVSNVAIIALEEEKKGGIEDFSLPNKRNGCGTKQRQRSRHIKESCKDGVSTHLGNDMIATSVVDAQGTMARVFFHLSTITNTSSAPKENTTCKEEYGE